ncbi:hypothetical protein GF374_02065 [Candidatus Woesearchaeota archaeon]|nr:hypothetical protein [Candidatus Woesearchaeota archaeon]
MGGKGSKLVIIIISLLLVMPLTSAGIYMGTVEGYVFYANQSLVPSASISASVSGCSGGGCSGSDTSDANGYYVIANLNADSGDTITSTATKAGYSGSETGVTDAGYAAEINVTICPSAPTIDIQSNTHNTNVTLNWTSGTDPSIPAVTTYDDYKFGGVTQNNVTSPQNETGLTYGSSYTWGARTCNLYCCSNWNTSSFTISNSAPTAPTLTDQDCASSNSVSLSWTSGTDPEGDATYDEYQFGLKTNYNISNVSSATSPQSESGIVSCRYYKWRVRTCDTLGECSSWSVDDFSTCSGGTTTVTTETTGGGSTGGVLTVGGAPNYVATISSPLFVGAGDDFIIYINYKSSSYTKRAKIEVTGPDGFTFIPKTIRNIDSGIEKTVSIRGLVDKDIKLGEYTLRFAAVKDDAEVLSKHFIIKVSKLLYPRCGNDICERPTETSENCITDCHCGDKSCQEKWDETVFTCPVDCMIAPYTPYWILLITTIAIAIIFVLLKKRKESKKELVKYVKRRLSKGHKTKKIKKDLKTVGWMESTIEEAFKKVKTKKKKKKKRKNN